MKRQTLRYPLRSLEPRFTTDYGHTLYSASPKTTYDEPHKLVGIDPRGRNVRMILKALGAEGSPARMSLLEAEGVAGDPGELETKTGWTNARLSSTG